MVEYTVEERAAIDHARERLDQDGVHNPRSCPYPCRALCDHYATIKAMVDAGKWPEELA
jgi:hypothetical protein